MRIFVDINILYFLCNNITKVTKIFQAAQFSKKYCSTIYPEKLKDGKVFSLNSMGPNKVDNFDPFSEELFKLAKDRKSILEIGAGFGYMTNKLLEGSNAKIIANDIDYRHLCNVINKVKPNNLNRLKLLLGALPDDIELENNKFDLISAICVIHFLTPDKVERSFRKFYQWLNHGGVIVFVNASVFHRFIDKNKTELESLISQGKNWVGEVHNLWELSPENKNYFPNYFNLGVKEDYIRIATQVGFKIDKLEYFSKNDNEKNAYLGGVLVKE